MLQRKEEDLLKRQAIERRALPKRIRAERKARDMMFRESLRISMISDPDAEREKLKRVIFHEKCFKILHINSRNFSSMSKRRNVTIKNNRGSRRST